jgi:outer membrane protein OmpA-like peptidoglycan-associated protein
MKKLLSLLLLITSLTISLNSHAQLGKLKEKIKQKVDDRVNRKTDQAIDKTLDGAENTVEGKNDNGSDNPTNNNSSSSKSSNSNNDAGKTVGIKSYSKYDFVPGDKILYAEDYLQDVVGEFPLNWNTNGSGEVTTIDGIPGKWLELQESTKYEVAIKNKLPDNYTMEFDVLFEYKDDQFVPNVEVTLQSEKLPGHVYGGKIQLTLAPNNGNAQTKDAVFYNSFTREGDNQLTATNKLVDTWSVFNHKKIPVHIAIWIQKQRFRAWINQEKVYDLPQGVGEGVVPNLLAFEVKNYGGPKENFKYFISNIKIAEATPDTRSKLITEGKWSTTGILFDVNSDKIKPSSYSVLKEIASVLSENVGVKVKIIGHTDSDGDDAKNLDLSKRRAAAVKAALTSEFAIDASRMETDGMGESKPVADNKTSEGKAQNRRVEFVKL